MFNKNGNLYILDESDGVFFFYFISRLEDKFKKNYGTNKNKIKHPIKYVNYLSVSRYEHDQRKDEEKKMEAKTIYTKKIKIPSGNKFSLPNENLFTFCYRYVHVDTNIIYFLIDITI